MKSTRTFLIGIIITGSLAAGLHFLHAQTAVAGGFNGGIAPVPSSPDSIVQLTADSQGLALMDQADLPGGGTFWWMMPYGSPVPAPCPPLDLSAPIYQMAEGQFLVDETGGQVALNNRLAANSTVNSALAAQADTVLNLIAQVQAATANEQVQTMSRAMGMDVPSPGGGGDSGDGGSYGSPYPAAPIDTNGLWLEITNVSNGIACLNLHNATNQVYEVWSKTNLSDASWSIETELWPTDTNSMPFTIPVLSRTNLFVWARDWTGVTSGGNTTPEWWFWEYFGTTALLDTNLDSQGNTLLYDYQYGKDPNFIQFTINVTNNYVNVTPTTAQLAVTGYPYYVAVLVDNTNFNDAVWSTYSSSTVAVNLGSRQGWHGVWIGLRGHADAASAAIWQWKRLNLALPPLLAITNPTSFVVDEPIIQIYGCCQEPLASISYDISNAVGEVANLPSEITDQYYDTNACGFTTNYFECLDVPLTNGLNTITIHATDLAGNITTTNFNFTLDYSSKTNPSVVQIAWPQNGTQISGSNFTCQGWISDPTATVATQLVFTNSNTNLFWNGIYTNMFVASVERNGNFWLENLPLTSGTNTFTVTVTDAVGNTSVTNISVVQSPLVLTINPVTPDSQLWQATVNLTGTISDPSYAVWVSGVKGHNNGDGTWSANNVPVNGGGTASFTATAYAPNEQQPDGSYGN